ncbi:MAG: hypothetical protein ACOX4M_10890 [Acetivibrionales bacterium]|jgi:predicted nucleic acid-binding protein
MQRYIGAISDTDILIHLAMVNRLDILELLFEKIIIPLYIYEEAADIFDRINNQLSRPSKDTFNDKYRKAIRRFKKNKWVKYLGIDT